MAWSCPSLHRELDSCRAVVVGVPAAGRQGHLEKLLMVTPTSFQHRRGSGMGLPRS